MSHPVHPCLWFHGNAEEAVAFYVATLPGGRILHTQRLGPGTDAPVLTIAFELGGQRYLALNGPMDFPFTEAVSLVLPCDTQAEIDRYWDALTADGGQPVQCGWLKDRFGLSWQVVPAKLPELLADPARAERVMAALMTMVKLDLPALEAA